MNDGRAQAKLGHASNLVTSTRLGRLSRSDPAAGMAILVMLSEELNKLELKLELA